MKYILLISSRNYGLNEMSRSIPNESVVSLNLEDKELNIKVPGASRNIIVANVGSELHDFDEDERKFIQSNINDPEIYTVDYKELSDLKMLLNFIANRDDVLIDNDFGVLTTGKKFLHYCNNHPEWDWVAKSHIPDIK